MATYILLVLSCIEGDKDFAPLTMSWNNFWRSKHSNVQICIFTAKGYFLWDDVNLCWLCHKMTCYCSAIVHVFTWIYADCKVIYPKYSKHWCYTVAHTIDCVCSKMLNHRFKSWVLSFTFQAYTLPHTLNCICVSPRLAWPHFCRTQLHSLPNGDFCPRIWTS